MVDSLSSSSLPPASAPPAPARRVGRASRRFFLVLVVAVAIASALLFKPLLPVLLFGAVLASSMRGPFEGFVGVVRGRRRLAAVLFAAAFALLIIAPVTLATLSVVGDIAGSAQGFGGRVAEEGVEGLISRLPQPVQSALTQLGLDGSDLQERISSITGKVVTASGAVLKATGLLLFALIMLVIALVIFLIEGKNIAAWLVDTVPLERRQTQELATEFHKISVSVVLGNFGTALTQAVVALVGFLIAGVPSALVFTLFTFIFSLVPNAGGAIVCLAAAAVVFFTDGVGWQPIFMVVWALLVVGTVDNVVKPMLVKRGVEIHGALVFFAILSGLAAFGAVGLLLGPFIVGYALTLIRIYRRDFRGHLDPTSPPVPAAPSTPPAPATSTPPTTTLTPAPAR